jgi:hypothetical protein
MKITWIEWFVLLVVIVTGSTIANLIALKIAADQVNASVSSSPLSGILGAITK